MRQILLSGIAAILTVLAFSNVWGMREEVAPIVDSTGLLLGGSAGGKWLKPQSVAPRLKGGEKYRLLRFSGEIETQIGGKPERDEASGAAYFIPFKNRPAASGATAAGIGSQSKIVPRSWRSESTTQKVYISAVSKVLAKHGLRVSRPHLTRVIRVDLDGKGENSVLIEAQNPDFELLPINGKRKLAYSLVLLRTMVKGRLKTILLGGEFVKPGDEGNLVEQLTLAPPIDLNGDGVFEIIVESRYYEGNGAQVYALKNGIPVVVLSEGAGA